METEIVVTTDYPTINYTNITPYVQPFDYTGVVVSAFIIFTFLILGLIGNGLTIAVIVTYKTLSKSIFMQFILSLCVSDFISALISWLFLYRRTWGFDQWDLPDIFCKFYWSVDIMTSYVTAGHILSFAILRLISIQNPQRFKKIKLAHGRAWIGLIWFICFCCGLVPSWFIFGARVRDRYSAYQDARWPACTILREKIDFYSLYHKIAFPIFLYVPTIGVIITCVLVVIFIKHRAKVSVNAHRTRQRREKQAVLQLVLIIASFLVGYIPFTAYEFWSAQKLPNTRYYHVTDYWFGMTEYLFLRFSECLNPLFYNLGSAKVYRHTKMFIKSKILCCFKWEKRPEIQSTKSKSNHLSSNTNPVSV